MKSCLADIWENNTEDENLSILKRLHQFDMAITAEELGISIEDLDRLAEQAGLVKVYATVVDVAGMRDYEPGVASPQFAARHRKR